MIRSVLARQRGADRESSRIAGEDAMDAASAARDMFARTNGADADGKVVWSWPPDAEVKLRAY